VNAVSVPVTLKIRTGWDRNNRNGLRIAQIAEASGIKALAVHGRTRADFYAGDAEYETIRAIKSGVRIPVFANGDIKTPQKAREVLDFTGADGVMLGRASHGAPWIFRSVNTYLAAGITAPPLSRAEVRDIILGHLGSLYAFYGEDLGVRIARKHLGWYCEQLLTDPVQTRRNLMASATTSLQFALVHDRLEDWVAEVGAAPGAMAGTLDGLTRGLRGGRDTFAGAARSD
jgi:tRNA-dihydrouridine synthase B